MWKETLFLVGLHVYPITMYQEKKSILKDNLEEEKKRILSIEHVDLNAGLSLGIRLTL